MGKNIQVFKNESECIIENLIWDKNYLTLNMKMSL